MANQNTSRVIPHLDALQMLGELKWEPASQAWGCIEPLGVIYWDDESRAVEFVIHQLDEGKAAQAGKDVTRLFHIRVQLWEKRKLSPEDAAFWAEAKCMLPDCPIFKREEISDELLELQRHPEEW